MAVALFVGLAEPVADLVDVELRGILGDGDRQLVGLLTVTHVQQPINTYLVLGRPLGGELPPHRVFEVAQGRYRVLQGIRCEGHHPGGDGVRAQVGQQHAEGAEIARVLGDQDAADAQGRGHRGGQRRPHAAEGSEDEVRGIEAPLDGDGAHGGDDVGHQHAQDPQGRLVLGHAQRLRHDAPDGVGRQLRIDGHLALEQRPGVQVAQLHQGVGQRGLVAATHVTGRSGHRPGALRPHLKHLAVAHLGQAAAARPQALHLHRIDPHGMAPDLPFGTEERPSRYQRHVAAGAADVQRDEVGGPGAGAQLVGGHHPRHGTGHQGLDRKPRHGLGRADAAVGLHQEGMRAREMPQHGLLHAREVLFHAWAEIGVQHRGGGALVLAPHRIHLR